MTRAYTITTIVAALPLLIGGAVRADLSYTLNGGLSGANMNVPQIKTVESYQGNKERTDATIALNDRSVEIVNIIDGDAGKVYTLNPQQKIYTVSNVSSLEPVPFGLGTELPGFGQNGRGLVLPMPRSTEPGESGTVTATVAVLDQGTQKVDHINAHHWTVTLNYTASGTATVDVPTAVINIWTDDSSQQPIDPLDNQSLNGSPAGGGVNYVYAGDVDKLKAILGSVPVRIQVNVGSGVIASYDRDNYSDHPLNAALFVLPVNGKQVSEEQFAQSVTGDVRAMLGAPSTSAIPAPQAATPNGANQSSIGGVAGIAPTVPAGGPAGGIGP